MTFILSKVLWIILKPSHLLFLALLVGIWCQLRWLLALTVTALLALLILPIPLWMTTFLEERFERPRELPQEIAGIIVLGGAQQVSIMEARNALALSEDAERLIEGIALALQFPNAKLVFSGGSGNLVPGRLRESDVNNLLMRMLRVDLDRVMMESQSRNTYENVTRSQEMLMPKPDENWVLVTSGYHMPRAVGIFERAGWSVIPYPVDYKTAGYDLIQTDPGLSYSLASLDTITREYIGLAAYYLMGRTSALLPGPAD